MAAAAYRFDSSERRAIASSTPGRGENGFSLLDSLNPGFVGVAPCRYAGVASTSARMRTGGAAFSLMKRHSSECGENARLIRCSEWQTGSMRTIVRVLVSAFALWLTTLIVGGSGAHGVWIEPISDVPAEPAADYRIGYIITLLLVALVFGLVNGTLGKVVRFVSIPLYIITLGL